MTTPEEAVQWLRNVDGQLYKSGRTPAGEQTWVAVVRTPRSGTKSAKLIIAMGETLLEATSAAEEQWHTIWRSLTALN